MALNFYRINSTLFHPYCYAMIKDVSTHDDMKRFFKMNLGDAEKIKIINLEFIANKGYTLKNIDKTDHIESSSALLFSKRFVDSVGDVLKDEMRFFPCKVICKGVSLDWYAAQIINLLPIVDKELSEYRDADKKLLQTIRYRTDIEGSFYIAKDSEYYTPFVVTDLFKDLCEEKGLGIEITSPRY